MGDECVWPITWYGKAGLYVTNIYVACSRHVINNVLRNVSGSSAVCESLVMPTSALNFSETVWSVFCFVSYLLEGQNDNQQQQQ